MTDSETKSKRGRRATAAPAVDSALLALIALIVLYEAALAQGMSIAPGPLFSASGRFRNGLRLNGALTWTPRVEEALRRLGGLAGSRLEG